MSTSTPPEIPGLVYVQPVGSGGYADVFLYEQQMPRMNVAVKVLKGEGLTPAIRRQFADEADTMAQLADHPYIVQVFRAETAADGRPYLVMKYYPPPNMAMRARSERFTVEEVLRIGIQLASAVETAHRAGITHRDIKPANVLVSQYGAPGLTDFGIAGRGGAAAEEEADDVGVSVPWAPPEVLFGQSNGDARADVYSLAATLWQLLVGRSPFEVGGGDNSAYALMPRIRSTPVPSTGRADVPVSLERLLGQAMAKDPDNRPATALALARALQEIEQEQRFPRTAIVVLDEQGQTTLADQTPSPTGEEDRTRVRSPQAVRSAQALPQPRPDDRRTSQAAYPPLSGSTSIPAAAQTNVATPRAATAPAGVPDDVAEEGTVRVDRSRAAGPPGPAAGPGPTATAGPPAAPAGDVERHEISPTVLLTGVAVVVAVLAAIALWAVFGRGDADPVATPARTVASQTDDDPVAIAPVPTISARGTTGGVAFSWSYAGAEKGDAYRFRSSATVDGLQDATFVPVATTTRVVTVAKGAQVCAQAQVIRSGSESNWSQPQCEKAG